MFKKVFQWIGSKIKKLGPGYLVCEQDNDAGAVATYISAGAHYGFGLYPLLLLLLPVTYFCQEACARIAIATQQGPITLIKQKFGVIWAKIAVYNLYLINFLTLITEFAGIHLISNAFHLNSYITIPISIIVLSLLVAPFNYTKWERIVVALCLFDVMWIILSLLTPIHGMNFNWSYGTWQPNYLMDIMAVVGTTIAPWQLIFQHSCILDKGMKPEELKSEQKETLFGSFFTIVIAACMMFVGGIAFFNHIHFIDVPTYAQQLRTLIGPAFSNILFLMIINASIIGTAGVTLSTSWAYAEDRNWPRGLNKSFKEAKKFYLQYFGSIVAAGLVTLAPYLQLEKVIISVQIMACLFLPYQLILNQIICNDESLMGKYKNKLGTNIVMTIVISLIIILSIFLFKQGIGL